jgi:hypothetical protein
VPALPGSKDRVGAGLSDVLGLKGWSVVRHSAEGGWLDVMRLIDCQHGVYGRMRSDGRGGYVARCVTCLDWLPVTGWAGAGGRAASEASAAPPGLS